MEYTTFNINLLTVINLQKDFNGLYKTKSLRAEVMRTRTTHVTVFFEHETDVSWFMVN